MKPIGVKILKKCSHKNSIRRDYLRTSTGDQFFGNVFAYIRMHTTDFLNDSKKVINGFKCIYKFTLKIKTFVTV